MQRLTVYPGFYSGELFLKICGPSHNKEQAIGFRINAQIRKMKNGVIYLRICFEGREREVRLQLQGFLPQAKTGEYWKFEAYIEGNKLIMLDAEKLADSPPLQRVSEAKVTGVEEASGPFLAGQMLERRFLEALDTVASGDIGCGAL